MQGYVARKGDRYYAVIYEGTDPITGRERRRWHPAGTDRADAERLAADLAQRRHNDGHERSSLTVAVYLTQRWLPSKKLTLRASTYDSYRRNIHLHVVPALGRRPLAKLTADDIDAFYAALLVDGYRKRSPHEKGGPKGLSPKSVRPAEYWRVTVWRRAVAPRVASIGSAVSAAACDVSCPVGVRLRPRRRIRRRARRHRYSRVRPGQRRLRRTCCQTCSRWRGVCPGRMGGLRSR